MMESRQPHVAVAKLTLRCAALFPTSLCHLISTHNIAAI